MSLPEKILYRCAKYFYNSEVAHSSNMKRSLASIDCYDAYRNAESERVIEACHQYGVEIHDKCVVDFGCSDGAVSVRYLTEGARKVIGVDIDDTAIQRATNLYASPQISFILSSPQHIPLDSCCADVIVSYDVFEHISHPPTILKELYRILKPGGKILIGTWGWFHPFAPHLWSTMPVPWAHVFFSEKTLLRVCRHVYCSDWYVPNMHDFDSNGNRLPDKYKHDSISTDYLNKYLIKDFENAFNLAGFVCRTHLIPFQSKQVKWLSAVMRLGYLREFFSGYVWFLLTKPALSS